jgi:hypothetical protein
MVSMRLVFIEEVGSHIAMTREYARGLATSAPTRCLVMAAWD